MNATARTPARPAELCWCARPGTPGDVNGVRHVCSTELREVLLADSRYLDEMPGVTATQVLGADTAFVHLTLGDNGAETTMTPTEATRLADALLATVGEVHCVCGKPATHLTADEDGDDWPCRVHDPKDDARSGLMVTIGAAPCVAEATAAGTDDRVDSTFCPDCRWIGGKHDPRVIHLPAEVEDHELDVWVREPGTADTYRLRVTEWSQHVSTSDHVLTLGELRRAYGPLHVAGSSL